MHMHALNGTLAHSLPLHTVHTHLWAVSVEWTKQRTCHRTTRICWLRICGTGDAWNSILNDTVKELLNFLIFTLYTSSLYQWLFGQFILIHIDVSMWLPLPLACTHITVQVNFCLNITWKAISAEAQLPPQPHIRSSTREHLCVQHLI